MPASLQAAASSLSGSRGKGVDFRHQSVNCERYMPKPSWCLLVMTMYFMPASLAIFTHSAASNFTGLNFPSELLILGYRELCLFEKPLAVLVVVFPLARGHGVHAPVDEHPEPCLAKPFHAGVVILRRFRG